MQPVLYTTGYKRNVIVHKISRKSENDSRRSLTVFNSGHLGLLDAAPGSQETVVNFRIGKQTASRSAGGPSRPVTLARELPQGDIIDRRDRHTR